MRKLIATGLIVVMLTSFALCTGRGGGESPVPTEQAGIEPRRTG